MLMLNLFMLKDMLDVLAMKWQTSWLMQQVLHNCHNLFYNKIHLNNQFAFFDLLCFDFFIHTNGRAPTNIAVCYGDCFVVVVYVLYLCFDFFTASRAHPRTSRTVLFSNMA